MIDRLHSANAAHRRVARAIALCAVVSLAGCGNSLRDKKHPVLLTQKDAAEYVVQALESPLADERRAAANRLAQSRHVDDPTVVKTLCLVARTDVSPAVRAAAVLALSRCSQTEAYEACVDVAMSATEKDALDSAAGKTRAIAMENLHTWVREGTLPEELSNRAADAAIRLLQSDFNRNVRVAAAQLLGYVATREAVLALIDGLEQRDFGVCYEAERSLMRLTGRTFDHDAQAWRTFVDQTNNLFADRGALDGQLEPAKRKWYDWRSSTGG